MNRYNLSQIMKDAWSMKRNRPEKYSTFSLALKASWHLNKARVARSERMDEVNAFQKSVKQQMTEREMRSEITKNRRAEAIAIAQKNVESECFDYGYGRGVHYNRFSGWGNYCGD